jgi:signal peptidase I
MDKNKIIKEIISWVFTILLAFAVVLVFNSKVMAKRDVSQSSMENTLFNEQQLLINKFSYNFRTPKRGEIIIFYEGERKGNLIDDSIELINNLIYNDEEHALHTRLVKRVIGVEGDEIDIKDGYVYVNGEKIEETYVKGTTLVDIIQFPLVVDEGKLFVLGDNREVSSDSRDFGLIECNQVEGKAFLRVFPFNEMGKVK